MANAPEKKLRLDRVFMVLLVIGGAGFAAYWFGMR